MNENLYKPSPKRENFFLLTGIIGLIADLIALSTLVATLFKSDNATSKLSWGVLFILMSSLILVYGWFVLTWITTRRSLNQFSSPSFIGKQDGLYDTALKATLGVSLFLLPLVFLWLIAAFFLSVFMGLIAVLVIFYFGQGGWKYISYCITILMPHFYEDLDGNAQIHIFQKHIEENWSEWEKRISIALERNKWITMDDLKSMDDLIDVPTLLYGLVIQKYTSLHPEKFKFGALVKRKNNKTMLVKTEGKVMAPIDRDLGEFFVV